MAEICEQILATIDIADVIGERVSLRRSGRGYSGLCPFHEERTPSFQVYTDTQSYYCFGCHESGNVITYVMKTENVGFSEALKILAYRAGITLTERRPGERSAYELFDLAAKFYADRLASSPEVLERLKLSVSDVSNFGLGYAHTSWDLLVRYLHRQRVTDQRMQELGLALSGRYGMYDKFRGRLMFPVKDIAGRVVGFCGRLIEGKGAEYINTSKGSDLYLLDLAKSAIHEKKHIILVSGYMDAIRLHKSGFPESVCTLGTTLTSEHVGVLSRMSNQCYVSYKADFRSMYALEKRGMKVYVIPPVEKIDPEEFEKAMKKARPLIEHHIYTSGKPKRELFASLSEVESYEVLWYKRQLSEVTGLLPSQVEECVLSKRMPSEAVKEKVEPDYEAGLCALMFHRAEYRQRMTKLEVPKLLKDATAQKVALAILTEKIESLKSLWTSQGDTEILSFLERGEEYCARMRDPDKWEKTYAKLRERYRTERMAEIQSRMEKSQATAEELAEFVRLKGESR